MTVVESAQLRAMLQVTSKLVRELAELQGRVERLELVVEHVAKEDRVSHDET